jgi:hypothetical protein
MFTSWVVLGGILLIVNTPCTLFPISDLGIKSEKQLSINVTDDITSVTTIKPESFVSIFNLF